MRGMHGENCYLMWLAYKGTEKRAGIPLYPIPDMERIYAGSEPTQPTSRANLRGVPNDPNGKTDAGLCIIHARPMRIPVYCLRLRRADQGC